MQVRISEQVFVSKEFLQSDGQGLQYLNGVKSLNILLGPNNVRKSRLVRSLFRSPNIVMNLSDDVSIDDSAIDELQEHFHNTRVDGFDSGFSISIHHGPAMYEQLRIGSELREILDDIRTNREEYNRIGSFDTNTMDGIVRNLRMYLKDPNDATESDLVYWTKIWGIVEVLLYFRFDFHSLNLRPMPAPWFNTEPVLGKGQEKMEEFLRKFSKVLYCVLNHYRCSNGEIIYIPVLRTLTPIIEQGSLLKTTFARATADYYNLGELPNVKIETGQKLYDELRALRLGKREDRDKLGAFEKFIGDTFFEGKAVDLMPRESGVVLSGSISFMVDNGNERFLHELGSGIQAIINLLYPLFFCTNDSFIFIEEPEIHLHPGYQRVLIDTICNNEELKAKNLTVFITTHSNHVVDLMRSRDAISYYLLHKENDQQTRVEIVDQNTLAILDSLGVSNSSVFMSDYSIWVEGPTDVKYLRKLFDSYSQKGGQKVLREDIDYAFLMYGGSLLANYDFSSNGESERLISARILSNRVVLIADRDINKEKKHMAIGDQTGHHMSYHITPGYEIESIFGRHLTIEALSELLKVADREVEEVFSFPNNYPWEKPLGKYCQDANWATKYFEDSGTLKSQFKGKYCDIMLKIIRWEFLPEETTSWIASIYSHMLK